MAGKRNAPKSGKLYAWSDLYCGGESEMTNFGRRIIHSRNVIKRGEEVSAGDVEQYGVSEEEFQSWVDQGSVRPYPLPEGYEGDVALGQSPYTYVVEKAKAELEAAENEANAESAEDRLIRASVAGTQVVGPNPEEVLMGHEPELPEGVEEPEDT